MSGDSRDHSTENEVAAALLEILEELTAEIHPHREPSGSVSMDCSLDRDLGLDSLARVELLVRVEDRLGVRLGEGEFMEAETPRDLLDIFFSEDRGRPRVVERSTSRIVTKDAEAAPDDARTLVEVFGWHAGAHADRVHVQFYADGAEGDTLTYGELADGAEAVAAGLQRKGLQKGDAVAIMLPTSREYFFSFLGILLAGGVPVPIYPPARKAQIEDHVKRHRAILNNCRATTLLTIPEAKPVARALESQVASLREISTVEGLSRTDGGYERQPVVSDDLAFLQYTSGSTGNPKGVMLTHANLLANIRAMSKAVQMDDTDVIVSWLPLYHDMGLIGMWMGALYTAVPFVLMSPLDFIARPERWLWAVHRYRGTISAGPNFAYELCLKRLDDGKLEGLDLSSWRVACNGAEPVSPDTIERFSRRFSAYGFRRETMMPVYGLAECSVGLSFPPLGRDYVVDRVDRKRYSRKGEAVPVRENEPNPLRFVGCGRPLADHEVRVVDGAGVELPERREGRIQFRGPSATRGYFENPEATKDLIRGDWLDTGDMGYIAGGEIFVTGRKKDIIIRAGQNIYPSELEDAIGDVPGIRKGNVAVFGAADESSGTERLVVLAETRETDPSAHEKIRAGINGLASELIGTPVDDIVLVGPHVVPKTSSGKIRRASSRNLYESGRIGRKPAAAWLQLARMRLRGFASELRGFLGTAAGFAYAGYAYATAAILVAIAFFPVVLLPSLSWRWAVLRATGRTLAFLHGVSIDVRGVENLPDDREFLLVSNHASYVDSYVLAAALPIHFRFVAKVELTKRFLVRLFVGRLGTEFVERFDKQRGIADARRIGSGASSGIPLCFFPEGGTYRMPGLTAFHMGAFVVAAESKLKVVPVALNGTRSILRSFSWFPRPGRVTVTIGAPIHPAAGEYADYSDTWSVGIRTRDRAREFILRHCGEPDLLPQRSSKNARE